MTAADRGVLVELYDTDAMTRLAVLEQAAEVQWLDQLSRPGACSFSLPIDDPKRTQLSDYRFVRMSWNGLSFGHRLSPEQTWQHRDGRSRVTYAGPGLGSLLDDAVLYPEYPLGPNTEDVRGFGPYSKAGDWFSNDAAWVNPPGTLTYSSDSGRRAGKPPVFKKVAPSAKWISPAATVYTDVADGTVFWARHTVTLAAATDCILVYTGDNFVDQWIDGRLVGQSDGQLYGWRKAKRIAVRLDAGDHVLCARIENAVTTTGANPYAYIAALCTADANGDPGTVLAKTGANWYVHPGTPEPGWYPGNILRRFCSEAATRSVKGALTLSYGFTTTTDSSSAAWTGDRITFERSLGDPGSEFAAALSELGLDWHVDWAAGVAPVLNVHNRRGINRATGAGTVRLFLPQGLKAYGTTRKHARKTALLGQRANGRWVERTLGVGTAGRMETSGAVAAAGSENTMALLVDALLRRTSAAQIDSTVSGSALVGPQPGSDYDPLGDSILVPGHLGAGHHKARSLGVAVSQDGESVRAWPLFSIDGS